MDAGEFICADGNTNVADFGFTLLNILSYSLHVTSGSSFMSNCSCNHSFLAGNLQAVELSSSVFSFNSASNVASSSAFASHFPLLAKKKSGSSISLSPSTLCKRRFQNLCSESFKL